MRGLIDALAEHLRGALGPDYYVTVHVSVLSTYYPKGMTSMQVFVADGTAAYFAAGTGQTIVLRLEEPDFLDQLTLAIQQWHIAQLDEIRKENEKQQSPGRTASRGSG